MQILLFTFTTIFSVALGVVISEMPSEAELEKAFADTYDAKYFKRTYSISSKDRCRHAWRDGHMNNVDTQNVNISSALKVFKCNIKFAHYSHPEITTRLCWYCLIEVTYEYKKKNSPSVDSDGTRPSTHEAFFVSKYDLNGVAYILEPSAGTGTPGQQNNALTKHIDWVRGIKHYPVAATPLNITGRVTTSVNKGIKKL